MSQNWRGSDWGRSEARPPCNNEWMHTFEQTIEAERAALPRAFPRRRKGVYLPIPAPPVLSTPRSTYQQFCEDLEPRLRPRFKEETPPLSPRGSPRRPLSARPDLQYGGDGINSTYRAEFCQHLEHRKAPRPSTARNPSRAAGVSLQREKHPLMCMDDNVDLARKIKILRAQACFQSKHANPNRPSLSASHTRPI